MRDILPDLEHWFDDGKSIALATVIETWGSSPRRAGAKMALTSDGRICGSVSGGCVEGAVVEAGIESLKTGQPRLLHFGVSDESAWEVGLACGGSIDIFVKPIDAHFFEHVRNVIAAEQPAVHVTVVCGPDHMLGRELLLVEAGVTSGRLDDEWNAEVIGLARAVLLEGISRRVFLAAGIEVFLEAILPTPTLVMVGGVHISVALSSLAKTLGYRTVVIDPRSAWGNEARFPHVDKLIQAWPDEAFQQINIVRSTAIAVLTHDPKLDDPALRVALSTPAFYVGALGSQSTHDKRRQRLLNGGMTESQLSRLHAPIGLDIGSQTAEEIALAVMAEVVSAYRRQEQPSAGREARAVVNS
jgi:xanthine dehydrogenase accessory factor